jgi:abortive infection bacteriophage resistance protein
MSQHTRRASVARHAISRRVFLFLEDGVKFEKPFLSIEEQVERLVKAGMMGDRDTVAQRLTVVSYHRLSGYWHPFQQTDGAFAPETSFEKVWRRYVFDRQLRVLVIDAIERFEVTLRTQLAYHHAQVHGPFGYAVNRASRPKMSRKDFPEFYFNLLEELARSKEPFIKEFYADHGDEYDVPPIWEAAEVMSFGCVVTLYRNTTHNVKQPVASIFGVPDAVMDSWLLVLNTVRNICAHHARLWNRELGTKALIPRQKEYPEWRKPVQIGNDRVFGVLTICRHCLKRVAPQSGWANRLQALLEKYPDIPIASMGFPENWKESPIWQDIK